jgi:prepilin-type N-terminal cleavage/methylation domain-containing protein
MLKKKGFTLLELIIVVIVVAILASLGIPQFIKTVERARASEGAGVLGALRGAFLRYYAEHTAYANVASALGVGSLDVTVGQLKNFNPPTIIAITGQGNIAGLTKSGGTIYTLNITDAGTIGCVGSAANCPLGY